MVAPEFLYLNEQAVRVTSWKQDDTTYTIEFVVIAQGETDRDRLLDIFSKEPVMVRIGSNSAIPMDVRSLDTRSTDDGPRSIYRVHVSLWPEGSVATRSEPEESAPLSSQEQKLDRIIELLTDIRDEMRTIGRG
jgi:hypothetical protein